MFKIISNIKSRLVFKITFLFIICVFVPLFSMTAFVFADINEKMIEEKEDIVNDVILEFEQNFERELNRYDSMVSSLIKNSVIAEYPLRSEEEITGEDAYELVNEFTTGENAVFDSVAFYYFNNNVNDFENIFCSASYVEKEIWYKQFFTSGKYAVWSMDAGKSTGNSLYRISKIFDDSEEIGVAVVEINIEKILRTILVEMKSEANLFAFDSQKTGFNINTEKTNKEIVKALENNGFFMQSNLDNRVFKFEDGKNIYTVKNIPEYGLSLGCFVTKNMNIFTDSSFIVLMIVFVILTVFVLLFYYFIVSIFRTFNADIERMNECIENNFTGRLSIKRNDEIGKIEKQFNLMLDKLDALGKKNILREQSQKQAEIKALQNQMNPHFIYNMLNTFRMKLVLNGDQQTAEEIAKFGKLIRYNMHTRENFVTLKEEVMHLNYYIDLQNERFTPKIVYDVQIPVGYGDTKIPKFILQPLAENSIKYGKKASAPLKITVAFENIDSKCFLISFTDNGKGCDRRTVQSLNSQLSSGRYIHKNDTETSSTIGLKNINERLRLIYGEEYHMTVNSEPDNFFEVLIRLPDIKG